MKKTMLIIAMAALSCVIFAAVSGYTFTYNLGTYTEISGGTLLGTTTSDDQRFVDPAVPAGGTTSTGVGFPIGFNFIYDGVTYDRVAINNNGWISLGQSALTPSVNIASSSSYTPIGSTSAIVPNQLVARISGLGRDLQAQAGASLRIETIGAPGSYECVVQWKNYRKYAATGDSYNFQIRLQEAGNKVVVMYGTMTNNATATTIQMGLRGAPDNVASNYKVMMTDTVTPSWNPPIPGAAVTSSLALSSTVFPLSGTTYEFQAPMVGVLSVSPNPVAFGNSYVGLTKTLTVTLSNSGAADFTLNSVTLGGGSYFTMGTLPGLPEVLSPAETFSFDISYTPGDANPHADVLTINDSRDTTTPINVTGTGVALLVGEICENPYLATLPLVNYLGTTAGYANDYVYQMYTGVGSSGYVLGKDWVAKFTIPSIGILDVSLLDQAGYSSQWMGMFLVNTIPSIAAPATILAQAYGSSAPQNIIGYNITPGDYYLIIDNWPSPADIYFDLSIAFTPASAPPNPALLVSPTPDGTLNVAPTATLNWAFGGGTVEKYYLYFGMDGGGVTPPTGIENGTDLNLLTTYDPTPDLQFGMTYYWQIVPWNSIGGFAVGCPIWSFTVMPDPTITTFPYMEGFEGGVTLPNGWTRTANGSASYNWEVVTTDASHGAAAPYDGQYFARLYVYLASTSYNPYSLVSPPIDLSGGAKKLGYWAWIGADGAPAPLDVEISTDGMATWNLLYSFDLSETNAWIYREHSLAGFNANPSYIRFKATSNYGYGFCDLGLDYIMIQDDTNVPVELSSFTATLTAQNYVTLSWVSQSESQMVGYLVYRNTTNDPATATLIDSPLIPATNTSTTQTYSATDVNVEIGSTYFYWLEAVDYTSSAYHGPVSVTVEGNIPPVLPELTTMKNAYPNPFKANTNIEVGLKAGETGTVTIYNISGQVVRSYTVGEGYHTVNWNGRDAKGQTCGSGIYFYRLTTPSLSQTRKLVLAK